MNQQRPADELDHELAYAIFRLTLGVNILIHGVTRIITGVEKFASETTVQFAQTPLSPALTHFFLVTLPFVETGIGALLVLGLWTRWALAVGGLLITALVFGTALRGDWNTVGVQMIYAVAYYLLLACRRHNYYSFDTIIRLWRS